jgi:hypothetical protein
MHMNEHVLANAKAYAALLGSVLTALLGTIPPQTQAWHILTAVSAVCTAVAVWRIPNAE